MRKRQTLSKIFGIALVFAMIGAMFGGWTGISRTLGAAPAAPTIISPGSSTGPGPTLTTLTPTLQWTAVSGADYYAIAISKYPYGSSNIIYNPQQVYGTSHVVPSGMLVPGEKYRWNMQAHGSGGWSAISNTLYFQTPGSPDLTVIGTVSFSPSSRMIGQSISVTFTVKNQGSSASGSFSNRISLATTQWGVDYSLGNFAMNSLGAGASRTVTITTNVIPSSVVCPGNYYVTVFTDGFQQISESNENNNIGSSTPHLLSVTCTPQTGSISVNSNLAGSGFTLSGPSGVSAITPYSISSAGVGTYTVTWGSRSGYTTPPSETKTLTAGGSISFYGYYVMDAPNEPTAEFFADVTNCCVPLTVQFTDLSTAGDNPITSWFWEFGDGATSTAQNPVYTYYDDNTYTVSLTVTDSHGYSDTETKENYITSNEGPTAGFSTDVNSLTVQFTELSTAGDNPITEWYWEFGDDDTSTEQNPSHTYNNAGTYPVTLDVMDLHGCGDSESTVVTVTYTPPTEVGRVVLIEPLQIIPADPYFVGDTLTASFTVANTGNGAITLDKLLLGGRYNGGELPSGGYPDFTYHTVTLQPGQTHKYQGTLSIPEPGEYQFFIAYYIENPTDPEKEYLDENNWNTCIELGEGLTDADRTRLLIMFAGSQVVITSPLTIFSSSPYYPYEVDDVLYTTFGITNKGDCPVTLDELVVGGRVGEYIVDFPKEYNVTLNPGDSHQYSGTLTLETPGLHHFFCTYYIADPAPAEARFLDENNWNTKIEVELDGHIVDNDIDADVYRTQLITVRAKGIYISAPQPQLWEELYGPWTTNPDGKEYEIRAVTADPTGQRLYVAVQRYLLGHYGRSAISENIYMFSGGAWQKISDGLPTLLINALAVAPSDPDVVYVGGAKLGVYMYENGSWHSLDGPKGGRSIFAASATVLSLAVDCVDPDVIYVGTRAYGIWKQTGDGEWKNIWDVLVSAQSEDVVRVLTSSPSKGGVVYAAAEIRHWNGSITPLGALKSSDYGSSWEQITITGKVLDLLNYPTVVNGIAVGGANDDNVYITTNSHQILIPLISPAGSTFIPFNAMADGVFRFDGEGPWDDEDRWHAASGQTSGNPLPEEDPDAVLVSRDFPNLVLTDFYDEIWFSHNYGDNWFPILKGERIKGLALIDAGDKPVVYAYGATKLLMLEMSHTAVMLKPHSPIELRVHDCEGRVTGLVNGVLKEQIPSSLCCDETVILFAPTDCDRYVVQGTAQGHYGLTANSLVGHDASAFIATDIPTSTGTVHEYTINWDVLSEGAAGVTIQVDSDGDGVFEREFTSDEELTQDEFTQQSPFCFIATAAYGTPMAEEIQILRDFRDSYLLTNPLGQAFVNLYYQVSPPIAEFITDHPSLKPIVRAALLPAVVMSEIVVDTTAAEKVVTLSILVLVSVVVAIWVIRRQGRGSEYT